MSPEIRINGKIIADVPDETGEHQMLDGSPLYIDVSEIGTLNKRQVLVLEGPNIGGRRVIELSHEGWGNSDDPKRRGDRKDPHLYVLLHNRPIRKAYRKRVDVENYSFVKSNPQRYEVYMNTHGRWMRR